MSDAIVATTIRFAGAHGDDINGYLARPTAPGPWPGVVVVHHNPGYDEATKEITRTFAVHGYQALCPNLHYRWLPDGDPVEASRLQREAGGVPDAQCIGDVAAAATHLGALPGAVGRIGVIGYCSGGRQAYLAACRLRFDAAVVCYGGRIVAGPDELTPAQPVAPVEETGALACPLLGLFGAQDTHPSPEQVSTLAEELRRHDKPFDFHTYPDAGHAFFSVDRPSYRVEAAAAGWREIWAFLATHLGTAPGA
jgi:carboxymethylenebutenolidase